ncbi:peptidoglycan recognition protein family protein [Corynebacterium amycolatum]
MADNAVDIDKHHLITFGRSTPLPKKRIIVHTTENAPGTSSQAILDYQVRTRTGSYHRLVDATGKITLANTDDWQTWSTGNKGNDIALHVSCVARAAMTREQWLAQPKMLEGVARVIAYWARTYDIPLVKLSRAELGAGRHGVAGHLEAQVWGNTDHWDPGYHFPYDVVLGRAKEINAGKSAPDAPTPPKPAPRTAMPQSWIKQAISRSTRAISYTTQNGTETFSKARRALRRAAWSMAVMARI